MGESFDVVVLGGVIAGLAAAREARAAGRSVVILEARAHAGGRMRSLTPVPGGPAVELGAEFIHGGRGDTWDLAREAKLRVLPAEGEHLLVGADGEIRRAPDFWERLDRVFERLPKPGDADLSFREFIDSAEGVTAEDRALALSFVEGFHASDPARISSIAVGHEAQSADESGGGAALYRLADGYGALIDYATSRLRADGVELRFGTIARGVSWGDGFVEVRTESDTAAGLFRGRAAIVALPLGVLQADPDAAGGVRFDPELVEKRGPLGGLVMGAVDKVTVRFDSEFWDATPLLRELGFLHSPNETFPTWWSRPADGAPAPWLVGWVGGSAAERLRGRSPGEVIHEALGSLARILRMPTYELGQAVEAVHYHDWQADPFARGAYSYASVGADACERELAKPLRDTLFFAGEATGFEGQIGTVDGALASGIRAGREVAAALAGESRGARAA